MESFEKKRPLYEDFCSAITKFLTDLLSQTGYKSQIFCRVKNLGRLKEKLIRKRKQGKLYRNLSAIDDLAGVRIIFYLEGDVQKFIKYLEEKLPNMAHVPKNNKKSNYTAEHYVVMLDDEKLESEEYKKFKNLKCEIQLTSIFNHVWSELEHDWIYKDVRRLRDKDPYKYGIIKKEMQMIFKKYVKQISIKFDRIAKQMLG